MRSSPNSSKSEKHSFQTNIDLNFLSIEGIKTKLPTCSSNSQGVAVGISKCNLTDSVSSKLIRKNQEQNSSSSDNTFLTCNNATISIVISFEIKETLSRWKPSTSALFQNCNDNPMPEDESFIERAKYKENNVHSNGGKQSFPVLQTFQA